MLALFLVCYSIRRETLGQLLGVTATQEELKWEHGLSGRTS